MNDASFILLQPTDFSLPCQFVNLAQVAHARLDNGVLVLQLSNGTQLNVDGPAKKELFKYLMNQSILPDGSKPPAETLTLFTDKLN